MNKSLGNSKDQAFHLEVAAATMESVVESGDLAVLSSSTSPCQPTKCRGMSPR